MSGLLPSECPNCGRLHKGHDFNAEPGPVQASLRVAQLALTRANETNLHLLAHVDRFRDLAVAAGSRPAVSGDER